MPSVSIFSMSRGLFSACLVCLLLACLLCLSSACLVCRVRSVLSRNCLHCTFSMHGPFFARTGQCAGPSYACFARMFTERQFGRDSRTCTDARYLRTQLHGDARTGWGAPLARNCTETKPNKVTARQPCHHAKHTNNTLVQRRRQFLQTLQREP